VFKRLASKLAIPGWLLLLFDAVIRLLDWAGRLEFVKEKVAAMMPWIHSALNAVTSPLGQTCLIAGGFVFLLIVATRPETKTEVDTTFERGQKLQIACSPTIEGCVVEALWTTNHEPLPVKFFRVAVNAVGKHQTIKNCTGFFKAH
jgi:hypothetical protein